jgi:hypothetical protein
LFATITYFDKSGDDKDVSWEYCKLIDNCKEKGDFNSSNHNCLVEWNDINKATSFVFELAHC